MLNIGVVGVLFMICAANAQVGQICRSNELFLSCGGCQKTCKNPDPVCASYCRVGCYCPEGLVRNETGECVPLSQCGQGKLSDEYQAEERVSCPTNEVYSECGSCQKSCDNSQLACPAMCHIGCFCAENLVRNSTGDCVDIKQCKKPVSNYLSDEYPQVDQYSNLPGKQKKCPVGEEFKECAVCHKTCDNPNPICPAQCSRGCSCKEGLLRNDEGKCVEPHMCKGKNLVKRQLYMPLCKANESFFGCVPCEKSCRIKDPFCIASCEPGCACKEGFVRSDGGDCIPEEDCPVGTCNDVNEEYSCRMPCEEFCSSKPCAKLVPKCIHGCYCKAGYLREDTTGECVKPESCTTPKNENLTV